MPLFNVLAGDNISIVKDTPGVTRDRIYADVEWLNHKFTLEKDRFSKTSIYHKPDCKNCWAKFYCSGGCNANNWQYEGDILL